MTKKEFLNQYLAAQEKIAINLDEIAKLREIATKTTQTLTKDKVQGNAENKIEVSVSKIVDIEREIWALLDNLDTVRHNVVNAIESVKDENLKTILQMHYINGKSFEQIAVDKHYSYRHTIRLHGIALHKVDIGKHVL